MLQHISKREKILVMVAVMAGLFLAALDQTIVGTALPRILTEFNALKELSWVITAYMLTATIATPISGKLSDLYGRRKMILAGIVIFLVGSVLCGIAQDIWQLIGFRAIQGLGGGILMANAFAVIGDLFAPRERSKWQGIFGAVFGLASVVGPLLGGFLTDQHAIFGLTTDWRWTFFINVPVGLVAFYLVWRHLPTITHKLKEKIDFLGAGLLSASLAALIIACSLGGTDGWAWSSTQIIGLFALSVVSLIGFVFAERRAEGAILPLSLFRNSIFNLTSLVTLLFGAAFFSAIVYVPLFAQDILHFSATNSGIITLPMVIGLTITSIISGRIVAKTGKYKLLFILGLAISAVGIYLLSFLDLSSTYAQMAWFMVVAGAGMGIAMPMFTLVVQNAVAPKLLGVATSSTQLFRSIGGTVGTAIMGSVLNNVMISKLGDIQNDKFVQMAKQSGQGEQFNKIDLNAVQGILSEQGQQAITNSLTRLPAQFQQAALTAFGNFTETLRTALASSITRIFVVAALLAVVSVVIALFIKEIPLKHHDMEDVPPMGDA